MTDKEIDDLINLKLRGFKIDRDLERLERSGKCLRIAGLIAFGLFWGFMISQCVPAALPHLK